jgi:hypothetical protein
MDGFEAAPRFGNGSFGGDGVGGEEDKSHTFIGGGWINVGRCGDP